MSDPTQPKDVNMNDPANAAAADSPPSATPSETGPTGPTETGDAVDGGQPPKAQAYVDPSIAAEAMQMTHEAEIADLKDKYVRVHAEMENLRKRTEREKADTSKYAISKFAGDVLAVADNLQRALAALSETADQADPKIKASIEGVQLTDSELAKVLERHGVRKIDALGAIFDPNFHQAVMEEENKEIPAGTVVRVFQHGYQISDRLLRPSMVIVAKGGAKPPKEAADPVAAVAEPANDDMPSAESEPSTDDNDPQT